jgi:hypothetical protein
VHRWRDAGDLLRFGEAPHVACPHVRPS